MVCVWAAFAPSRVGRDPGGKTYGILECGCGRYPVVADIPVLQSDKQRLLHLISKGAYEEALLTAAAPRVHPSSPMLPAFVRRLAAIRGLSRPRRWFVTAANGRCRSELGKLLANPTTTFSDLLNFRYRKALGWNDAYDYFRFRLGQPRHLVALSLAAMIQRPSQALDRSGSRLHMLQGGRGTPISGERVFGNLQF